MICALLYVHAGSAVRAETFSYRITDEPESLDWHIAHSTQETLFLTNLMEGLLTFDAQFRIAPALAERWTISPDGRVYTFYLRPHVKWSDGVPLRAQDFVFGWKRLMSPLTGAFYAYLLNDIEGALDFTSGKNADFSAVGVKALDDHTLQVRLARPIAHWISIPTMWPTYPLREDIVTKYGTSWATPGRMVTAGPYILESYEKGRKIILRANPRYYGTRGNVDQVIGIVAKDDASALALWESNKLDYLPEISNVEAARFQGRPELRTYPQIRTDYVGFVVNRFPAIYPGLRRAIAYAIDKTKLARLLGGGRKPATSFVPPPLLGYSKLLGLPFDIKKAKLELKKAGLSTSQTIRLELIHADWEKPALVAKFLQSELKKNLGIEITVKAYDGVAYNALLDTGQIPMYIGRWSGDFPDPDNFMTLFAYGDRKNRTRWQNNAYDAAINEARGLRDEKKRLGLYTQAQKKLLEEEAVIVPLYYEPNSVLLHSWVEKADINPLMYLYIKNIRINSAKKPQ